MVRQKDVRFLRWVVDIDQHASVCVGHVVLIVGVHAAALCINFVVVLLRVGWERRGFFSLAVGIADQCDVFVTAGNLYDVIIFVVRFKQEKWDEMLEMRRIKILSFSFNNTK